MTESFGFKSSSITLFQSIPGELILFSSMLTHHVPKNISDKPRISLSFNTYPKIPFGSEIGLTKVI